MNNSPEERAAFDDCYHKVPALVRREEFDSIYRFLKHRFGADELVADAQRFKGIRMLLCEPDEAMQERMFAAVEQQMEAIEPPKPLTAEFINDMVDRLILIAAGARRGDSDPQ